MLAACGGRDARLGAFDTHEGSGSFLVAAEGDDCIATSPFINLLQSRATPERLTMAVWQAEGAPAEFFVGDRPVLSIALSGDTEGWSQVTFPDARTFWAAFGQADRIVAGAQSQGLADQAALRDRMTACLWGTDA